MKVNKLLCFLIKCEISGYLYEKARYVAIMHG